jgi:hypothetical protein
MSGIQMVIPHFARKAPVTANRSAVYPHESP